MPQEEGLSADCLSSSHFYSNFPGANCEIKQRIAQIPAGALNFQAPNGCV
jgi:hypothetical protein